MIHTTPLTAKQAVEKTLNTLGETLAAPNWRDKTAAWFSQYALGVWEYRIDDTLEYRGGIIALKEGDYIVKINIIDTRITGFADNDEYTIPLPSDIRGKLDAFLEELYYRQRDEICK